LPRADRLFALVHLLSGSRRYGIAELAERLETTGRSIYRDLADLETRGFAIERAEGRYRLIDSSTVRRLPLTARERLLLAVALENPLFDRHPTMKAVRRQLAAKVGGDQESRPPAVLAGPERGGAPDEAIVAAIEEAIEASHAITILYSSISSQQCAWRGIDPWVMLHRAAAWYLVGRCHIHDEPRTFRLDRITAVLPMGGSFVGPRDFDVNEWFANSWEVSASSEAVDVRIVFESAVAPLIEHALHHPSEAKRRLSDGRLEYRVRIGPLDELARWIVGFGGQAIAVDPPELVEKVRAIAVEAAEAHSRKRARRAAMTKGAR
jgi:predicted DNA-binding transcriptional regulator YafY